MSVTSCLSLQIVYIYLYMFNSREMWVSPVVHKSEGSFLFMHNWTTVHLRQLGPKPEVSEYVGKFHELRM